MKVDVKQDNQEKIQKILRWSGTIIAFLLLAFLIYQQDWPQIASTVQDLSVYILISVWMLLFSRIFVNGLRWFIVLKIYKIEIRFWESWRLFLLGMFISNFLPTTIGGDGVRFLALLRFEDDKATALSSIIGDRLINIVAMICLLPISGWVFFDAIADRTWLNRVSSLSFLGLPGKLSAVVNSVKSLVKEFLELFNSPWLLGAGFLAAWSAQLIYFYGLWLLANNLGMQIDYLSVIGITVVAYMITLLPISINGYGVREITLTSLYTLLGFPVEGAVSLAIISRLIYMTTTLPGALWLPENMSSISRSDS